MSTAFKDCSLFIYIPISASESPDHSSLSNAVWLFLFFLNVIAAGAGAAAAIIILPSDVKVP